MRAAGALAVVSFLAWASVAVATRTLAAAPNDSVQAPGALSRRDDHICLISLAADGDNWPGVV